MYYTTQVAQLPSASSTSKLPRSRIGPVPSSSAYRYGSSHSSYTEPFPVRQPALPVQVSRLCSQPQPRTPPVKRSTGSAALPSACAQSARTATCPARMPTPQGSNAPVRRVEEGCHLAPLKLPTCNEHELSLGSHALEDRQIRVRAYLDDLPGSASTPKLHLEHHAPSHSHSTQRGYAPAGTDPYFQGTVRNIGAPTPVPPTGAMCSSLKEIGSSAQPNPSSPRFTQGNMMLYEVMIRALREIHSCRSSTLTVLDVISQFILLRSSGLPTRQTQSLLTGELRRRVTPDFAHSFDRVASAIQSCMDSAL